MQSISPANRPHPWTQAALLLAAPAILWLGAFGISAASDGRPGEFDAAGMALAARGHMPLADAFFRTVTWAGSILVLMPLALAHTLLAWRRLRSTAALFLPAALVGASLMAYATKIAVARDRPDVAALIDMPTDASFPSAHTLQASAFALAWLIAPSRSGRPHVAEIALAMLLVGLVAWSRLHLQVHFPTDVLFALAAGIVWVLCLRRLPIWSKTT
jgi:undecaprenyl-diphosphatase